MTLEDILVGMNSEPCWSKMKRLASNNFVAETSLGSEKCSVIFHAIVVMMIKATSDIQTSHDTNLIKIVKSIESCLEIGMYASHLKVDYKCIQFPRKNSSKLFSCVINITNLTSTVGKV